MGSLHFPDCTLPVNNWGPSSIVRNKVFDEIIVEVAAADHGIFAQGRPIIGALHLKRKKCDRSFDYMRMLVLS